MAPRMTTGVNLIRAFLSNSNYHLILEADLIDLLYIQKDAQELNLLPQFSFINSGSKQNRSK